MSKKNPGNIAASVRQRILNKARNDKRPFSELLQYYAMERFLYRLAHSSHSDQFILKGALLFRAWHSPETRPTMDIDMLGKTSNEIGNILDKMRRIIDAGVVPDGLVFDPNSLSAERITEDAVYEGIRIRFTGTLDTAQIPMQLDIGFGDVVFPKVSEADIPAILDFPAPRILCYSKESAIAEKFEAMLKLGQLNSRMKDFYDIWYLARHFDFLGSDLSQAIQKTLDHRGTLLTSTVPIFESSFSENKQAQWAAFLRRIHTSDIPENFSEVTEFLQLFLEPIVKSLLGHTIPNRWHAPGPWT